VADLGEFTQRIGTWIFLGGFGLSVGLSVLRIAVSFRRRAWLLPMSIAGYYARAVGMVGLVVMMAGLVLRGYAEWWALLLFLALGGGTAIAILLTRPVTTDNPFGLDMPRRPKG
jgi:hypothetical protein